MTTRLDKYIEYYIFYIENSFSRIVYKNICKTRNNQSKSNKLWG